MSEQGNAKGYDKEFEAGPFRSPFVNPTNPIVGGAIFAIKPNWYIRAYLGSYWQNGGAYLGCALYDVNGNQFQGLRDPAGKNVDNPFYFPSNPAPGAGGAIHNHGACTFSDIPAPGGFLQITPFTGLPESQVPKTIRGKCGGFDYYYLEDWSARGEHHITSPCDFKWRVFFSTKPRAIMALLDSPSQNATGNVWASP